jgi:hypothetical protein
MTDKSQASHPWDAGSVSECRKLRNHLVAGRVSFKEYAYNVTLHIIGCANDSLQACVEDIPEELRRQYAEYLRGFLEPVDFMPCPLPFLATWKSQELIERKKVELRPKYIRLYGLVSGQS